MTVADTLALFADLSQQLPPAVITTDRHALMPCGRCGGRGRETCPYPRHYDIAQLWDPTCRGCGGAGRVLRCVGAWR